MDRLTFIANQQLHPQQRRAADSYSLYYGDSKNSCYGPTYYSWCVAEKKRMKQANPLLKETFFKIK